LRTSGRRVRRAFFAPRNSPPDRVSGRGCGAPFFAALGGIVWGPLAGTFRRRLWGANFGDSPAVGEGLSGDG